MSKLAANAGLDTSNVPQLPLPQAPQQPQVRLGVDEWPVGLLQVACGQQAGTAVALEQ